MANSRRRLSRTVRWGFRLAVPFMDAALSIAYFVAFCLLVKAILWFVERL